MKIFKQESDISCGIACLRIIFSYYGKNLTEKEILEKNEFYNIDNKKVLNPLISLGVTALRLGFDVTYIGYNPIIVNNNSKEDLKKSLDEKSKKYFEIGKFYVDKTLEFINLKGNIITKKLNIKEIKKLIDENKFILVEIKPAFINKNSLISYIHKVIINKYDENSFHILDPSGKEYDIDFDTFLMAFYATIPEALIIKKI